MRPPGLTFLSWNLALLERSAAAPHAWELHDTEAAIREVVLQAAPDIVLYQELPRMVPFVETHGMIPANPRSNSGHLATLLRSDLLERHVLSHTVVDGAVLVTLDEPAVTIANVHLAPGPGAAAQRLHQLAAIAEASPTEQLVVIGDTNTRIDEITAVEAAGFSAPKPPAPTWDSRRNQFRSPGAQFSAYFTRTFSSPGVEVTDLEVLSRPIERDGRRFHLSDHFALRGSVAPA